MMYDIEDLKSRALVESNILKQFILSVTAKKKGEFKPKLDDILIHEYQLANSVTMNVILSNYVVDLAYAIDCIQNPLYYGTKDSYFKLVRGLDVENTVLADETRLILDVSDDDGTFKTRDLVLALNEIWNENVNVTEFKNLDSIWYCIKREGDPGHDTLGIVYEMNNFHKFPNPFGDNPFAKELFYPNGMSMNVTFNDWLGEDGKKELNCIIENRFFKTDMRDEGAVVPDNRFGYIISNCRYLFCVPDGFYGLESNWGTDEHGARTFRGFILHDIGGILPILGKDKDFDYQFCSFHVIGKGDETTLFLVIRESNGKYHYLYINESSLDETYGFTEVDSVVVDQLIVPPSQVFSRMDSIKYLDTVNIALTDYGFWDIESNTTNNVTNSYRGGKHYADDIGKLNGNMSKLVTPTIQMASKDIAVEYSCTKDEEYVWDSSEPPISTGIDRIWSMAPDGYWYFCKGLVVNPSKPEGDVNRYKKYRSSIVAAGGSELPFFGGTEHFAVYNSSSDDPINILVNLTLEQFTNLIFANSQLTTYFIEWLYRAVAQGPRVVDDIEIHSGFGEYYLWNYNPQFITNLASSLSRNVFDGLLLQLGKSYHPKDSTTPQVKLDVATKFALIEDVVKGYDPSVSTMTQYCNTLDAIVTAEYGTGTKKIDVSWLVDNGTFDSGEARIENTMRDLFSNITWKDEKFKPFVKSTLDALVSQNGGYPLLSYFRDYLNIHLENDLKDFTLDGALASTPTLVFDSSEKERVVKAVQEYIKSKVSASLVIGGYRYTGTEDNHRYPRIDQYLYQNQRKLNKVQVRDVMSITNTLKEVMFAVQSTDFVANCDSFDEMNFKKDNDDLFTMTQNADFVALSKLVSVNSDNEVSLNVDWDTDTETKTSVKTWMFGNSLDNCSDQNMLRAFVRTQIYRPLFFKHDNYINFTSNVSIYWCDPTKWFTDHDGIEHQIVFDDWPTSFDVDKDKSGLRDSDKPYTIDGIKYFNISNKFEYQINYDPVDIKDNKFVVNDIEFYVVRPKEADPTPDMAINSIYFNEFQNNTEGQNQVARVTNNKFKLNGVEYVIEGNEISIDAATKVFDESKTDTTHAKYKEWKCDIVDDRFCFDETWYILESDSTGNYAYVKYADNKDTKLIPLYVLDNGYAEYRPWNISFQFNSTWTQVTVVKKHQSDVVDRLKDEWCEFDGTVEEPNNIVFTEHKTYDWYLANEILRIQKNHQSQSQALLNLGNGNIYNGALELTTNQTLGTKCIVQIRNVVQNEDVVTICELVKKYGDVEQVQQMGTLFDRDLNLDTHRAFRGKFKDNLVKTPSDEGYSSITGTEKVIFVKDIGRGLNNINTAWAEYSTWNASHQIVQGVGEASLNEDTGIMSVSWDGSDFSETDGVTFTPVYKVDGEGNTTTDIIKYQVTIDDGIEQYTVWANGNFVHFIVNGNRYRLDTLAMTVDRLVVSDMLASTVDFSTSYSPTQLRDNLAQNVKTTMLNQMVQAVIDSTLSTTGSIAIDFKRPIGKYLDLFTDSSSLESYVVAWDLDIGSDQCVKFSQIYKNNLEDIDESNIANGNVYGHLKRNIESAFLDPNTHNQRQTMLVVDSPSIEVRRVVPVDTFTYIVVMDVHIVQNKKWMSEKFKNSPTGLDQKFVIANAIVKDVNCKVKFTPVYSGTTGKMTYDVLYSVDTSKRYTVKYNQIVYNYNGKTKLKTISPEGEILNVNFNAVSGLNLQYSDSGRELSLLTDELLSANIERIFGVPDDLESNYTKMFTFINNLIDNGVQQVIDNSVVDNPGMEDSIWPLDVQMPDPLPGELVSVNGGWTHIRGQTYNVSNDATKLIPATSGTGYNISNVPTNSYVTSNVVAILVPTSETSWSYKYVTAYDGSTTLTVVSSKSSIGANFKFDSDSQDAYSWIETTFFRGAASKVVDIKEGSTTIRQSVELKRSNFNVTQFQELTSPPEQVKVATSTNVLLRTSDVIDKFTLRSIGSDDSKQLFLTYNGTSELPNRFAVRSSDDFSIVTSNLVNLGEYERSIRVEDTDEAHIKNFVYKNTSPGFYPVENWLTSGQINGKLIWMYNGYNDIDVGQYIDPDRYFTIERTFDKPDDSEETPAPTPVDEIVEFDFGPMEVLRVDELPKDSEGEELGEEGILYIVKSTGKAYYWEYNESGDESGYKFVETTDRWNGRFGLRGKVKIQFIDIYGDTPKAKVLSDHVVGYSLESLPDTRTGVDVVDIQEYTPLETPNDPEKYLSVDILDKEIEVPQEGGESKIVIKRTYKVLPKMRVITKKFALNNGLSYIATNGMYIKCSGLLDTQYVIVAKDFGGSNVGLMNYCYLSIPTDIDDTADKEYYESICKPGQEIDDVPHRTTSQYTWSYSAYFELQNNTGANTPIWAKYSGGNYKNGLDYPVSLVVMPAGKVSDEDGDVNNRVFEVQTKVYANHMDMSDTENMKVWIDKASMAASIEAIPNKPDWRKLIYSGTDYDEAVPPRMREGIEKLISKIVFLDENYFKLTLTQLRTFLGMIRDELWQGLDSSSRAEIAKICEFNYSLSNVAFKNHKSDRDKWNNVNDGLFGYRTGQAGTTYSESLVNLNNHLLDEFKSDWRKLVVTVSDQQYVDGQPNPEYIGTRDYHYVLKGERSTVEDIEEKRLGTLQILCGEVNMPVAQSATIEEIFKTLSNKVRFINAIKTTLAGNLVEMFVANNTCNLFVEEAGVTTPRIQWYTFNSESHTMDGIVLDTISSNNREYVYQPQLKFLQYQIVSDNWLFKMLNRDFVGTSRIADAFAVHCREAGQELWYVPQLDSYVCATTSTGGILDLAYEQYEDRLYVLFNGDNYLYAYDGIAQTKEFNGFVTLRKEIASMKLATFNSMCLTDNELCFDRMFLDYFRNPDDKNANYHNWNIVLYGKNLSYNPTRYNVERWYFRPGADRDDFQLYNAIMFGDSLFDEGQLRFHNISKNKDMYDILDVNEVDGRYYGLFLNEDVGTRANDESTYTVFRIERNGGIVQRLPWQILEPHMYKTNDDLYTLYVVSNEPKDGETYHPVLREISVPDSYEYPNRVIDIYELYKNNNGDTAWDETSKKFEVVNLIMDEFKLKSKDGRFFALTSKGFHEVNYVDDFDQLSIDGINDFREALEKTLGDVVIGKHMAEMHDDEQKNYFQFLKSKINQFADDFTVFELIPTEFVETQDVGVIPNGQVNDVDDVDDHRNDSILTSTDILWTDGLVAQTDSNPGIVTAAVSNPATIYDDDNVFTKSQRNPSIEGTEFYDFIYDQEGNTLMDLYSIPFIYRINSNNTYDLYINIPTTRTKYLNRIAGTLMDNGTNQVLPGDTRTRINFLDEMMPNNLDESTTRLQVFIDKKYISIGTVDLVEISGNSIPTQIYRDVPNNGLYDSIALESKWNGEVVQIDEPSKDINKVMLEFECYGTDSQSIHIQGKTLINRALNESEYGNLENVPSTEAQRVVLTFYPNGGAVDEVTRVCVVGDLVGELPVPTWEGHTFLGWFTGPGGEHLPDGIQVKDDSFVTSDMETLYAHWEEI